MFTDWTEACVGLVLYRMTSPLLYILLQANSAVHRNAEMSTTEWWSLSVILGHTHEPDQLLLLQSCKEFQVAL